MLQFIIRVILNGLALWVLSAVYSPIQIQGSIQDILITLLIFGLANVLVKPLLKIITTPLKVITLGILNLIINLGINFLLFWAASLYAPALKVSGDLKTLFIASLIYSIITWIVNKIVR